MDIVAVEDAGKISKLLLNVFVYKKPNKMYFDIREEILRDVKFIS